MARIRTIKPEFPQSETIGRLSRDARLLFIQLWTIVDDEGRTRGASRMLASLLYPYDDDAPGLIDGWLAELEREECVERYEVDGSCYLQITNWAKHQRVDKPTASKLPAPRHGSRIFANAREPSCTDLGPRTVDQEGEEPSSLRSDGRDLAAPDPTAIIREQLWAEGPGIVQELSGKTDRQARALIAKALQHANGDAVVVMDVLDRASRDPPEALEPWLIGAVKHRIKGNGHAHSTHRPSAEQEFWLRHAGPADVGAHPPVAAHPPARRG